MEKNSSNIDTKKLFTFLLSIFGFRNSFFLFLYSSLLLEHNLFFFTPNTRKIHDQLMNDDDDDDCEKFCIYFLFHCHNSLASKTKSNAHTHTHTHKDTETFQRYTKSHTLKYNDTTIQNVFVMFCFYCCLYYCYCCSRC